jgi:hypothetical protein
MRETLAKLAVVLAVLGLLFIAVFHARELTAELHGPELDAAGK